MSGSFKLCKNKLHMREIGIRTCLECRRAADKNRYYNGHRRAYMKARYDADPTRQIEYSKAYNKANPKRHSELQVLSQKRNPGKCRANIVKYKISKIQRTPRWLTKEHLKQIEEIYSLRKENQHVDHIIPLRGRNVSGLHVPWNLQILSGPDNCSKSNKLELVG